MTEQVNVLAIGPIGHRATISCDPISRAALYKFVLNQYMVNGLSNWLIKPASKN